MERSLSHKSDGRHSSAGHSVHSHHSVPSGRASSLGVDTNYPVDDDDDDSFEMPGPPVSFYVLGTVPSIVRCWLTQDYAHGTLLYADICTGAQRSTVDYTLVQDLDLEDKMHRDADGVYRIRLNVYFAEAMITQHSGRSSASEGYVPSITVPFEVSGMMEQSASSNERKLIRIFVGSDALRAHSADILFSSNTMILYGDGHERLRVPFVRPEDDTIFRHICTGHVFPEKPKLNANAAPFVFGEVNKVAAQETAIETNQNADEEETDEVEADLGHGNLLHQDEPPQSSKPNASYPVSETGPKVDDSIRVGVESEAGTHKGGSSLSSDTSRRESSTGIWGSWRQASGSGPDREIGLLSGYQPAARSGRNMKVLKPQKSSSTSAKMGALYEPPPLPRSAVDGRRKSQIGSTGDGGPNGGSRWDRKRAVSAGVDAKPLQVAQQTPPNSREGRGAGATLPRSANPVGGASAFSWMTPPNKLSKASATVAE